MLNGTLSKLKVLAIAAVTLLVLIVILQNTQAVVGSGGRLGHVVKTTVLQIAPDRVKLGFEVDDDVPGHREVVRQRMCATGELVAGNDFTKSNSNFQSNIPAARRRTGQNHFFF